MPRPPLSSSSCRTAALASAALALALSACATPNLRVQSLTHSPLAPNSVDPIIVEAVVVNQGSKSAPPSQLLLKVGGETNPPKFAVPSLAPGKTYTVIRKLVLGVAQSYQITAMADATGVVQESNEGDNSAAAFFTVKAWTINDWLDSHLVIAQQIRWEQPSAIPNDMLAYPFWTPAMKADLAAAYAKVHRDTPAGLPPIPDGELTLDGAGNVFSVRITKDLAWQYYVAYTAQSLAAEVQGWFPWSLASYGAADLAWLFDSRLLFGWGTGYQRYTIDRAHPTLVSQGMATPADPGTTLRLVDSIGLAGATDGATLDNLFAWDRDHLQHFYGAETPDNLYAHWGFHGYPPVDRILRGTNRDVGDGTTEFGHWTAGCWGTTGFVKLVAKVLNIPVELTKLRAVGGSHATPHFRAQGKYWSHGDDPYSWLTRELIPATPPIAPSEYVVDEATYQSWFGPAVSDAVSGKNVGRRVAEVGVAKLSDYLLQQECYDQAHALTHATGQVYASLSNFYTVAELENQTLWTRLDQKIATLGGCGAIP